MVKNDAFWMNEAYQLALRALEEGEVPVGAVLVSAENKLIGEGYNQILQNSDPCAHAEMIAIRTAASLQQNHRLLNSTLYVTLEPCSMCAGALVHARIKRLVFAARDFKAGAAGSVYNLLRGYPLNHAIQIDEGILEHACARILKDFFKKRRSTSI